LTEKNTERGCASKQSAEENIWTYGEGSNRTMEKTTWKLHKCYFSPFIIRVFKSSRMKGVGHITSMVEMGNACKVLARKCDRKNHLGHTSINGRTILAWILWK
jgi:hypothetical protein